MLAVGLMAFALLKSYSRGAWIGALAGAFHLANSARKGLLFQHPGAPEEPILGRMVQRVQRNKASICVLALSLLVVSFWALRWTENRVIRRVFSVANVDDFSWRNRVSSYWGALQMIGDKPWFGFGWNQPEPVFEAYYQADRLAEAMAMRLNDYLVLGAALGLPALTCFAAYVASCLCSREVGSGLTAEERAMSLLMSFKVGANNQRAMGVFTKRFAGRV